LLAFALAVLRLGAVVERGRGVGQAGVVGLLGVLLPPADESRARALYPVELLAQRGQRPRPPRCQLLFADAVGGFGPALPPRGGHPGHCPVVGGAGGTTVRAQGPLLPGVRIEGEPVRLHHETRLGPELPAHSAVSPHFEDPLTAPNEHHPQRSRVRRRNTRSSSGEARTRARTGQDTR
jgi:hypothetical protein